MEDIKSLEFLAFNSKEIIEKQVDSYRQQHSYAGTIIGVVVLFIPFFLNSFDTTLTITQYIAILPIALFIWAMLCMLSTFRTKPLDQAFSVAKYQHFLNKTYNEILLNEIESNSNSYNKNLLITNKSSKRYSLGVSLTSIAFIVSIALLLANQFIKMEKGPTKVQVVNINTLR